MRKVRIFLLLLGLCWFSGQGMFLYAQYEGAEEEIEDDEEYPDEDILAETDWDGYVADLYSRGDQTFSVALGVLFPMFFHNSEPEIITHNFFPVGGAGSLAYTYFLNAHFFMGLEIGIVFNYTLGKNTIFIIPIGVRTGWQFIIRRFEFPISLAVGIAPQRYLNLSYSPGMYMKLGVAGFFRFSPEWSFGLNTDWNWYPQWPRKEKTRIPEHDVYANFFAITLCARYHF